MTKEELNELNQTAYDTVVRKLFLMKDYTGSTHEPFHEVYFKGEITSVKVVVQDAEDSQDEVHTFTVLDNKHQDLGYGSRTLYHYTYPSSQFFLDEKFGEFIRLIAQSYQNEQNARIAEANEKQMVKDRIDAAMRLKNFVTSF